MNITIQQELTELANKALAYVNRDTAIVSCDGVWSGGRFACTKTHFIAGNEDRTIAAKFQMIDGVLHRLSELSVDVINGFEYFYAPSGDLHYSNINNYIDANGYRAGSRFAATAATAHRALELVRDIAVQA